MSKQIVCHIRTKLELACKLNRTPTMLPLTSAFSCAISLGRTVVSAQRYTNDRITSIDTTFMKPIRTVWPDIHFPLTKNNRVCSWLALPVPSRWAVIWIYRPSVYVVTHGWSYLIDVYQYKCLGIESTAFRWHFLWFKQLPLHIFLFFPRFNRPDNTLSREFQ